MKKILLLTLFLLGSAPALSSAQIISTDDDGNAQHYGGGKHFGSVTGTYVSEGWTPGEFADAEHTEARNVYGVMLEASALPLATLFGGRGGFELGTGFGYPGGDSFFGGFRFHAGIVLMPIDWRIIRVGAAVGVGVGGHRYAYLAPEATLSLGPLAIKASYKWVPPSTSRVFGEEQKLGARGYEERRLRGELFLSLMQYELLDGDLESRRGIRFYIERSEVDSPAPELFALENLAPGTYWGGGVGYAF